MCKQCCFSQILPTLVESSNGCRIPGNSYIMTTVPVFISARTNKPAKLQVPSVTLPAQYPSEWFEKNPGKKPLAFYSYNPALADADVVKAVYFGIRKNKLDVNLVKRFLHVHLSKFTITLEKEWKSFGTIIGAKDAEVTPLAAVEIERKVLESGAEETTDHPIGSEDWIFGLLLCAARLAPITLQSYLDQVKDKIFNQLKVLGCNLPMFPARSFYESWILDDSYSKMVCAIDMFFTNHPEFQLSSLRICTLSCRFKDCAGYLTLGYMSNLLSLEDESLLLDWVWTKKMGEEIDKMIHENQEVMMPESYFPYQSGMKLVKKTHYSASIAPNTYFMFHSVGVLLQSTRSKNARFISDQNLVINMQNAKVMAYAFASCVALTKAYKREGLREKDIGEIAGDIKGEPSTADGSEWFDYMKALEFKLTEPMKRFIARAKESIGETREGTIREYVKTHF